MFWKNKISEFKKTHTHNIMDDSKRGILPRPLNSPLLCGPLVVDMITLTLCMTVYQCNSKLIAIIISLFTV